MKKTAWVHIDPRTKEVYDVHMRDKKPARCEKNIECYFPATVSYRLPKKSV